MSVGRIDKILAHEGFGTRKGIKKLLKECEVTVNGVRVFDSGTQVNPDKDILCVDGEEVLLRKNVYLMMNKAQNVVSANKDGLHQTAFDFLSDEYKTPYLQEHLHIVGRLDIDTEGLLFFTTDRALTHKIISPKTHFPKPTKNILPKTDGGFLLNDRRQRSNRRNNIVSAVTFAAAGRIYTKSFAKSS